MEPELIYVLSPKHLLVRKMDSYPKDLGNNLWIIEVKSKGGNIEELCIKLLPDALNQMGWYDAFFE